MGGTWTNTDRLRWLDVSRQLAADPGETPQVREKGRADAVWWEQEITKHGGEIPPDPYASPAPPSPPAPDRDRSYDLEPDAFGAAAGMMAVLSDPDDGVMRHLPAGSPQWLAAARVTGLYYRRTDHDEPSPQEWAAAVAEAARYEDEPGDYDDDPDGYASACATLAVSHAAKVGADPAGPDADESTGSALEWATETTGRSAAVLGRKYDDAYETGTDEEEAHRDIQHTHTLEGRLDTLTLASDGDGWDIDAHHPIGREVEAIEWLREHDMLDKRHHDPDTGETLAEWREGAHTTFSANERGRHYLGAVAHELDKPVPAGSMVACPKCGRACLLAPLDIDAPDDDGGPRHWHPVADPTAHQGVRMLISCPRPEEPPADLTPTLTPTVTATGGGGGPPVWMPQFGNVVEAWQAMLDVPLPEDGAVDDLESWFAGLAGTLHELGSVLGETVGDWYHASPLAPRLLEHLAQLGVHLRAMADTADQTLEVWHTEHAEAIRRQREQRPGEAMLNVSPT